MAIFINIKTEIWNSILKKLINRNWSVVYKYDAFDAGIDSDFVILEKDGEEILLGWDNWLEGEIQCSEERMKEIYQLTNQVFEQGEPVNLKPSVIALHRKWKDERK